MHCVRTITRIVHSLPFACMSLKAIASMYEGIWIVCDTL